MSIEEVVQRLLPCWIMGIFMLGLVWNSSHREILKISPRAVVKFIIYMAIFVSFRFLVLKFIASPKMIEGMREMANFLPWQTALGVFWEDACHSMPLVILGRMFASEKWYSYISKPLLLMTMLAFGSGHMYQGWLAAISLSFYIPFTISMAKRYGFGTIMICHIIYDMITLLSLKWMVGA